MKQSEIKILKLAALNPSTWNPREISPEAMDGLSASLERFGCVDLPIINKRDGKMSIVGGHQRVEALKAAGVEETECVLVDLSENDEKALNISLNNPNIQGRFTPDLDAILEDLRLDFDIPTDLLRLDKLLEKPDPELMDAMLESAKEPKAKQDVQYKNSFNVLVVCKSEEEQTEVLSKVLELGWDGRALIS